MKNEKVLSKIASILRKAKDDATTPDVAANYIEKANEMLRKYNLSMKDLTVSEIKKNVAEKNGIDIKTRKGFGNWKGVVASMLASHLNLRAIILNEDDVTYVGNDVTVSTGAFMYNYIIDVFEKAAKKYYIEMDKDEKAQKSRRKIYASFLGGAVIGLKQNLKTLKKQSEIEKTSEYGLVVMNNNEALDLYMKEKYGRMGNKKVNVSISDYSAKEKGKMVGRSVKFNKQVKSTNKVKRIK